jgi:hypothetical protein
MKSIVFIAAVIACICFYLLKNRNISYKKIIWGLYAVIFAVASYLFLSKAINRMITPEIWDFTCFYLYGKVAVGGYDFYQPANFHLVFNSLHLPFLDYKEFIDEVVNVGFPYPPQTILYFAPLGLFDYKVGLVLWTLLNLFFAFGCIYQIYKQFFKEDKLNGFILLCSLFFILTPSRSTVFYSQTNFIILFYLLLIKRYSDRGIAGIFLALAFFTKPYLLILCGYFIVRRKWKALAYFLISTIILSGLTIALFGTEPFLSYLHNNSALRLPAFVYSETINQSLHAVLLRLNLISLNRPIIYASIAGIILILTGIYLLFLLKRNLFDYILPTLLLVGLLIYPGTLSYYGVVLLFIIFQFFNEKNQLGFSIYINIFIVGLFYFLSSYSFFTCICFLLVVMILKSFGFFDRIRFGAAGV